MINYIKGKVTSVGDNTIVIENSNGIGYELICSSSACLKYNSEAGEVKIETYMHVREDAIVLYGFEDKNEKNMFLKLITVSGVGPKLAITILSGCSPTNLAISILNGDLSSLSKIKGLGKKTAEKIIVELKENVGRLEDMQTGIKVSAPSNNQNIEDAALALCALGISKTDAIKLASKVYEPNMTSEEIIRRSLKDMGK